MAAPGLELRLELSYRERHSSPSWSARWWPRRTDVRLIPGEFAVLPVSLPELLAHSLRDSRPVPISRIRRTADRRSDRSFRLPRDLQAIAAGMVLCAALWAAWSSTRPPGAALPAITASNGIAGRKLRGGPVGWLQQAIATRATVELSDRFRAGLDVWSAGTNSASWTYTPAASNRRSRVALYRPSLALTDYRVEFLAQVDRKSVGWVVRAQNFQNFYALDLRVVKSGRRPMLSLVRYPVVEGREGRRVEVPVPFRLQNNVPYRIAMDVKGRQFAASIDGQEIDSWSEDTLSAGGVGLLSEAGAHARVFWVKVTNNDDLLGRICGHLAGALSSGPRTQAWLGRPAGWAGPPLWGPQFFFTTARAMETPGGEGSMTYGLPGTGDGRRGCPGGSPAGSRRWKTG